jgi:hypothetical protein
MIVATEPSGLMMIRYKFYFNQQNADPEDAWVLAYFQEHGLEPRRELHEEHEGIPYKVFHFGQCYLGRHVTELSVLYQRGIEHTVLAQYLLDFLSHTQDADLCEATAGLTLPHGKNSPQLWQHACMPPPSSRRRKTEICGW